MVARFDLQTGTMARASAFGEATGTMARELPGVSCMVISTIECWLLPLALVSEKGSSHFILQIMEY
jgi:hypothetical protein